MKALFLFVLAILGLSLNNQAHADNTTWSCMRQGKRFRRLSFRRRGRLPHKV